MSEVLPHITVVKRDGSNQSYDSKKIEAAVKAAAAEVGVPVCVADIVGAVTANVADVAANKDGRIEVETIQDIVSTALLEPSTLQVANAFIKHRLKRAAIRQDRLKPDPSAIKDYMQVSKYAKWREDLGNRRETREETIARRKAMDLENFPHISDTIHWVYDDFISKDLVLASMRSLQFAGEAIQRENNRIYNCLSLDTEFITDQGVRSFADYADGDRVRVRTGTGAWAWATVRSYGRQQLHTITVTRGSTRKTVRATANHRWYLDDGQVTTNLRVGDRLALAAPVHFDLDTCSIEELHDWCAGFAAGDGTKQGSRWLLRLCGHKALLLRHFERAGYDVKHWPSFNGDPAVYLPINDDQERSLAFLEGLMAADGDHTYPSVASSNPETVAWVSQHAPVLGRYILSEKVDNRPTNFGPRTHPLHVFRFMRTEPSLATSNSQFSHWKVRSIEPDSVETVWCLEVDGDDKSFTLPFGLVTGNCSATLIDRVDVFGEILFELLCGCGVGYSVQWRHVNQLPELKHVDDSDVEHYQIPDTITGWATAVNKLISSYMLTGRYVEFAFHKLRKKGARLKTAGGCAPGHLPLKKALDAVRAILHQAQGRKLRPIECHHIVCQLACAVLSGGIRRSALICIFSLDDGEMMMCKTGEWWKTNPHLAVANNSVALLRGECTREQFERIFESTRQMGEPGVYFTSCLDYLPNPCVEIGFNPILKINADTKPILAKMIEDGYTIHKSEQRLGLQYSAFGHCNLSSIVINEKFDRGKFLDCARAASAIGTIQAAYNKLRYLHWASTAVLRRDSLIGVSMTGMVSRPDIAFNPEVLEEGAEVVNAVNIELAGKLGIRPAARTTCIKPEGSGTLWAGRNEHGMHGAWSRRQLRRIVANENEAPFRHFRSINPHMCTQKPDGDWVITFPMESPDSAITRDELYGVEFLKVAKTIQQHWVLPGTMRQTDGAGLTHNVSCTCSVPAEDWQEVIDYMWENKNYFCAVAFLPYDGDKRYSFAPNEAVVTHADEVYYNSLIRDYKPVDYTTMKEDEDTTAFSQEAACAGGACTL